MDSIQNAFGIRGGDDDDDYVVHGRVCFTQRNCSICEVGNAE